MTILTYADQEPLFEGQVASGYSYNARSGVNGQGTSQTAVLPFGRLVYRGTDPPGPGGVQSVILPNTTDGVVAGIVAYRASYESPHSSDQRGYPGAAIVPLITDGEVGVWAEGSVAITDTVFFRVATNGTLTELGRFRTDNDSGNAIELSGAQFESARTGAGVVRLSLNRIENQ